MLDKALSNRDVQQRYLKEELDIKDEETIKEHAQDDKGRTVDEKD